MVEVSACLIVRSEEEVLARCLRSLGKFPDELIIVDTGSTDKTIEIAKSFGAAVYNFEWVEDFAAARNFSFGKATKPYIFWCDADDVILPDDLAKLIELKSHLIHDMYVMPYDYFQDDNTRIVYRGEKIGRSVCLLDRERIIRNDPKFRWRYPIHEVIPLDNAIWQKVDIRITHRRTGGGACSDSGRNIRMLTKALKGAEYKDDPRLRYYLAKEYQDAGDAAYQKPGQSLEEYYAEVRGYNKQAIKHYKRFLKRKDGWWEDYVCAQHRTAHCYHTLSLLDDESEDQKTRYRELAKEAALKCIGMDYRWAEPYYILGRIAWDIADYRGAIHWFELCRRLPVPSVLAPVRPDYYTWLPNLQLAVMYDKVGDRETAYKRNLEGLKQNPTHRILQNNDKWFQEVLGFNLLKEEPKKQSIRIGWTGKGAALEAPQFRIRTHNINRWLQEQGCESEIIDYSEIDNYDVIVFSQGSYDPNYMKEAKQKGKRVILNLCEALFEFNCEQYIAAIKLADMVVCCSTKLAEMVKEHTKQTNTVVIEDAVEADFEKNCPYMISKELTVGWIGMGGSSPYAEKLRPLIDSLGYKLVTIHEHDNADIPWSLDTWQEELLKCDIGIAPANYEKQPAKSNNRLTTYMALGLPVIASPLPAYLEVIKDGVNGFIARTDEEWEKYLRLLRYVEERQEIGRAGKEVAHDHYSIDIIGQKWADLLNAETVDKTVDIIVTTYGGTDPESEQYPYLQECLKSINACTRHPHNVIVVDAKPNGWNFSQTINHGIQQGSAPYICFLNDDVIVSEGWLKSLVDRIKGNVGYANPLSNCDKRWLHNYDLVVDGVDLGPGTTTLRDGKIVEKNNPDGSAADPTHIYTFESPSKKVYARDWCAFFCTVFSREVIDKVGCLDEEFKTGSEDLDYCTRAGKLGYKGVIDEQSFVFHFGGVSRKAHEDENFQKHQEEDKYNNNRIQFKYGKPTILLQTGWAYDLWDGNTLREKGLGGSETWAVRMAEEWVKTGCRVVVFAQTGKSPQMINGVEWHDQNDWHRFISMNWVDIYMVSRYVDFLFDNVRAGKKFIVSHDIFLIRGHGEHRWKLKKIYDQIDGVGVMSEWHRDFFADWHQVPKDKIFVLGNGIDPEMFQGEENE